MRLTSTDSDSNPDFQINLDSDPDACRRQSFRRVSWKSPGDCMRNANKSLLKFSYSTSTSGIRRLSGTWSPPKVTGLIISTGIGVNFYKAARLEPPPQFFVTCNAYYEAVLCGLPNNKMTPKWYSCQSDHQFRSNPAMEAASCKQNCVGIFQH